MKINRLIAFGFCALCLSTTAKADIVTVLFEGDVEHFLDVLDSVGNPGTISGSFTYDSAASAIFTSTNRVVYGTAITAVNFNVNGNLFIVGGGDSIFVDNNLVPGQDAIQITIPFNDAFGYQGISLRFNLEDNSGNVFANTDLPLELNLGDFDSAKFSLVGDKPGTAFNLKDLRLDGTITAFATQNPVPQFTCAGFMPPFDKSLALKNKNKRAIPVNISLIDDSGYIVTDFDVSAPPVINVHFNGTVFGDAPTDDVDLLSAGSANEDNLFRFDPAIDQWIYNLGTKQFEAAGVYMVTVESGDPFEYEISTVGGTCTQIFERLP